LHLIPGGTDDEPDVLLFDEVQRAAAPKYRKELARFQRTRMYGFGATWDARWDNAHRVLEGLFGPVLFSIGYQECEKLGLVCPMKVEWIPIRCGKVFAETKNPVARMRQRVWQNDERSALIMKKAEEFSLDDQVLILTATLEHAVMLGRFNPGFTLVYGQSNKDEYEAYMRKGLINEQEQPFVTKQLRNEYRRRFEDDQLKKVISTGVWKVGVSFNALRALFQAAAESSEDSTTQGAGRPTRTDTTTGKQYGLVVDCWDVFDEGLLKRSRERRKIYTSMGWENEPIAGERRMPRAKPAE
jgi:superfamily II DNA or RNA helicase